MKNLLLTLVVLLIGHTAFACNSGLSTLVFPANGFYPRVIVNNKSIYNTPPGAIAYTFINYGDGTSQLDYVNGKTYYHQYLREGNYQIMLAIVVMDSTSSGKTILCTDTSWANANTVATACLSFFRHNGTGKSDVQVSLDEFYIAGVKYEWDFGDNSPLDTGRALHHYYNATGDYTIKLTASTNTCSVTQYAEIKVDTIFNCDSLPNDINITYNLKKRIAVANTLNLPDHRIIGTRSIDYGDGTPLTTLSYHTYAQPGTYTVTFYSQWKKNDNSMICLDTTRKVVTVKDDTIDCSKARVWFDIKRNYFYRSVTCVTRIDTSVPPHPNMIPASFYYDYGDGSPIRTSPPITTYTYPATNATYNITFYMIWRSIDSAAICTTSLVKPVTIEQSPLDCSNVKAVISAGIDPDDTTLIHVSTAGSVGPPTDLPSNISGFNFDYGDGTPATSSAYHRYSAAGTYQIKFLARWYNQADNTNYCDDTASTFVTIGPIPPFDCSKGKLNLNLEVSRFSRLTVSANNNGSYRPPYGYYTSPYEYQFSFDNDSYSPANSKTYTTPGIHRVILEAHWQDIFPGGSTCIVRDTEYISLGDFDCNFAKASFYPLPDTGRMGVSVYNNATTPPSADAIKNYTYLYGDGTGVTSDSTHIYTTPGKYTIYMFAEWTDPANNNNKCYDTATQQVVIGPIQFDCAKGNAAFTHAVQIKTATLYNISVKPSLKATAAYTFDYGDGSSVTSSITHNYATHGTYNVHMYAVWTDPANSSTICYDTALQSITVLANPVNCSTAQASFTRSVSGDTVSITNNSVSPASYLIPAYTYNYDDGTGVQTAVSHIYTTAGTYNISLYAKWLDPADGVTVICSDTATQSVTILPPPVNCNNAQASFTASITNATVTITNNSVSPSGSLTSGYSYDYGDGSSINQNTSHTYSTSGTYTISLFADWKDQANTVICSDTATQTVTITLPPPVNTIQGTVRGTAVNTSYKVWLISYTPTTLTAIDSVIVNTPAGVDTAAYRFDNEPSDDYLIKAQDMNSTPAHIPTYSINSAYWSGAAHVSHTGLQIYGQDINMLPGTPAPGPGFIGGSISAGANRLGRRTGNDVTDILILLRNNTGTPIASTRTDVNGNYYFANIATGTYDIYPELPGYSTVVFPVTVGVGHDSAESINFHINTKSKTITPAPTGIYNVMLQQQPAIYPNPTTGIVTITGLQQDATIFVSDITGRIVLQTEKISSTTTTVNLSLYRSGVYFINIKADGVNYSNKIVLQR